MNLTYKEGVKKTPAITRAVECMDKFFDGEPSFITSGLRTPLDQLKIIIEKSIRHTVDYPEFRDNLGRGPEFTVHVQELGRDLYYWQRTWSRLLSIHDIVNPPVPAECLFDYTADGRNKKGEIIGTSNHMRGLSFDIGGADRLLEKSKCVLKAKESGECFIHNFLIESVNNAIHIDTVQIG